MQDMWRPPPRIRLDFLGSRLAAGIFALKFFSCLGNRVEMLMMSALQPEISVNAKIRTETFCITDIPISYAAGWRVNEVTSRVTFLGSLRREREGKGGEGGGDEG